MAMNIEMTEKMILAITEIAETGAELWDVFDICDKHKLNSAEESLVITVFEESKQEMIKLMEQQEDELREELEEQRMSDATEHFKSISLDDIKNTGF